VSRYFTRAPRAGKPLYIETPLWHDAPDALLPHIDVPEHESSFTGLLDDKGEEIWRAPRPVGFGRDKEW
jgi:hypothetical protein